MERATERETILRGQRTKRVVRETINWAVTEVRRAKGFAPWELAVFSSTATLEMRHVRETKVTSVFPRLRLMDDASCNQSLPSTVRIASCLHETFCGMLVVL